MFILDDRIFRIVLMSSIKLDHVEPIDPVKAVRVDVGVN